MGCWGLSFFLVSMAGNFVGTYFVSRKYFSRKTSRFVALAFSYKLSFSVIVALFGLQSGLFSSSFFQRFYDCCVAFFCDSFVSS